MYVVSDYLPIQDAFYDLFPKAREYHAKRFYNPLTQTIDGAPHSVDDIPVLKRTNRTYILSWNRFGKPHRDVHPENGLSRPAVITIHNPMHDAENKLSASKCLTLAYYNDGLLHRKDGPALISNEFQCFFLYGVRVGCPIKCHERNAQIQLPFLPEWYAREYKNDRSVEYFTPPRVDREPTIDYNAWIGDQMGKMRQSYEIFGPQINELEVRAVKKYADDQLIREPGTVFKSVYTTVLSTDMMIINNCLNEMFSAGPPVDV